MSESARYYGEATPPLIKGGIVIFGALVVLMIAAFAWSYFNPQHSGFSGEKVWYETRRIPRFRPGAGYRAGFRSGPSCSCCGAGDKNCSCHSGCYCRRSGECPTHLNSGIVAGSEVVQQPHAAAMCQCCGLHISQCSCPPHCQCRLNGGCPHSRG